MNEPGQVQGALRRAYRALYWWRHDRELLRPLRGIRTAVAFGESVGDNLLCSVVLEALQAEGAGPLAMLTPFPDLFEGAPPPLRLLPFSPDLIATLRRRGPRLVLPNYGAFDPVLDRHSPQPRGHLIAEMCRSAGLRGRVALKPILRLSAAERSAGVALSAGCILIQTGSQGAPIPSANKDWPQGRWQEVADGLVGRLPVAQIGSASDPLLRGVRDLRGRLSRREVAAALAAARLFAGPEGFLMHAARAVDCRSVIVLGGRTAPGQTCYPENANLYTAVACAPCWQRNTCHFGRMCLEQISVAEVLAAIGAQLALPPLAGPGVTVELGPDA
jgi:hypothetical protein